MECKSLIYGFSQDGESEELIDTLWNVNHPHQRDEPRSGNRINRYIMECKS